MVEKEIKCKRCGLCCYRLTTDGVIFPEKCKYLIQVSPQTAVCRIYKKRLGTLVFKGAACTFRENWPYNIPGCPYNRSEWPEAKILYWRKK